MGRKKVNVSIADVAAKANVSTATVSRVLNNKGNVVEKTRRQVLKAASELNYHDPRQEGIGEKRLILVSIPPLNVDIHTDLLLGIYDSIKGSNCIPVIMHSLKDPIKEEEIYQVAIDNHFSGAILVSPKAPERAVLNLSKKMPVVQCFDYVKAPGVNVIKMNDFQGAYDVTKYLIDKGHRRIGIITSDEFTTSARDREQGYKKALSDHDIRFQNKLVFPAPYDFELNRENVLTILEQHRSFDALVCTGSLIAYRLLIEAKRSGLCVPEDFSIVGFDDILLRDAFDPMLTTISQDAYSVGCYAIALLLSNPSAGKGSGSGVVSTVEYQINERGSVADRLPPPTTRLNITTRSRRK